MITDVAKTKAGMNALVWQEEDLFVAKALDLEVASQGKSPMEAIKNLEEAIELFFHDESLPFPTTTYKNASLHPITPKISYA